MQTYNRHAHACLNSQRTINYHDFPNLAIFLFCFTNADVFIFLFSIDI